MPVYRSERFFHFINGMILLLVSLTMILPLVHLLAVSLSDPNWVGSSAVTFWPRGFNLIAYKQIFALDPLWRSFLISIYVCVMGTFVFFVFTTTLAYSLSRVSMPYRRVILVGILVTIVFSAPLIPTYLLIRSIGLGNTLWAIMVPGALSAFSVIILKTFMQGISNELMDAARIDGCSEYGIFGRIVIPMSLPALATLGLFHVVGLWNTYFNAIIYLRDKSIFPLQVVLRNLIIENQAQNAVGLAGGLEGIVMPATPEQLKAGIVLVATVPILLVYPFIQKYFVKGAMLGSLKE